MWRLTLILNALIMAAFGFGSALSQMHLYNERVRYGSDNPILTDLAVISA